jgi:STAS domain-containing protein
MVLDATPGMLRLQFDSRFTVADAKHLRDSVLALAPIGRLTLDFTRVRDLQDAALATVAATLSGLHDTRVVVRGLTTHHWRLLRYFGIEESAMAA